MPEEQKNPQPRSEELNPKPKSPSKFLQDGEGKPSAMRLMSIIALFASIFFGWMTLSNGTTSPNNMNGVYITTAFLIAVFSPKALQKFVENYYPKGQHPKPG